MKKLSQVVLVSLALIFLSMPAFALPLSVFDGWTVIADDDGYDSDGFVDPGWGGQDFDAEYLFVKQIGSQLSIGLQTGFNLNTGKVTHFNNSNVGKDYYAGDLALSFDGNSSSYEYAFDFGLYTEGYTDGNKISINETGIDASGLYEDVIWNNNIYFDGDPSGQADSAPFAMDSGTSVESGSNVWGLFDDSYYRIVSFDLASLNIDIAGIDAHWTMSCGNDEINGSYAPVPEPATMLLLGSGLVGLAFYRRRMKK